MAIDEKKLERAKKEILEYVEAHPYVKGKDLAEEVRGSDDTIDEAIDDLIDEDKLVESGSGFSVPGGGTKIMKAASKILEREPKEATEGKPRGPEPPGKKEEKKAEPAKEKKGRFFPKTPEGSRLSKIAFWIKWIWSKWFVLAFTVGALGMFGQGSPGAIILLLLAIFWTDTFTKKFKEKTGKTVYFWIKFVVTFFMFAFIGAVV